MAELDPQIRGALLDGFIATEAFFRRGAWYIGTVMVCSGALAVARGVWIAAAFTSGFFGLLVMFMLRSAKRYRDPASSPVFGAILDAPDRIAGISISESGSSTFLHIRLKDREHLGLRLDPQIARLVREALLVRSPDASTARR